MRCAGCGEQMVEESFDGRYGPSVQVDLCHACNGIWFDDRESLQLSPGAVVRLCQRMHERRSPNRQPLSELMSCPRCRQRLKSTWDMRGATRFQYFRCPSNHGRFITFFNFMKEKDIVRGLTPKQLNDLRSQVKVVNCSNCGAPVDLEKGSACEHCGAALSAIDPAQMEATLRKLQAEEQRRGEVDPTLAARLTLEKLEASRVYARLEGEDLADRLRRGTRSAGADLFGVGLELAVEVFKLWF